MHQSGPTRPLPGAPGLGTDRDWNAAMPLPGAVHHACEPLRAAGGIGGSQTWRVLHGTLLVRHSSCPSLIGAETDHWPLGRAAGTLL